MKNLIASKISHAVSEKSLPLSVRNQCSPGFRREDGGRPLVQSIVATFLRLEH